MVGLFESMWRREQLGHVNVFAVTALFTDLIQLSAEMRVANPILAANAIRKFDTALEVMRALSEYWLNADIILRLFEESSERLRNELRLGRATTMLSNTCEGGEGQEDAAQARNNGLAVSLDHGMLHGDSAFEALNSVAPPMQQGNSVEFPDLDWTSLYWDNTALLQLDTV